MLARGRVPVQVPEGPGVFVPLSLAELGPLPRAVVDLHLDPLNRRAPGRAHDPVLVFFLRTTLAGTDLSRSRPTDVSSHTISPFCSSWRMVTYSRAMK